MSGIGGRARGQPPVMRCSRSILRARRGRCIRRRGESAGTFRVRRGHPKGGDGREVARDKLLRASTDPWAATHPPASSASSGSGACGSAEASGQE
jgi:hypothetical protein